MNSRRTVRWVTIAWLSLMLGCAPRPATIATAGAYPTPLASPVWYEVEGRFSTTDLARAQQETPFPIILPTYLPSVRSWGITGTMRANQDPSRARVFIVFTLYDEDGRTPSLAIFETNYLGLPSSGYSGEINIGGHKVIEGTVTEGVLHYFYYFECDGVSIQAEFKDLARDKSLTVVASMLG